MAHTLNSISENRIRKLWWTDLLEKLMIYSHTWEVYLDWLLWPLDIYLGTTTSAALNFKFVIKCSKISKSKEVNFLMIATLKVMITSLLMILKKSILIFWFTSNICFTLCWRKCALASSGKAWLHFRIDWQKLGTKWTSIKFYIKSLSSQEAVNAFSMKIKLSSSIFKKNFQ